MPKYYFYLKVKVFSYNRIAGVFYFTMIAIEQRVHGANLFKKFSSRTSIITRSQPILINQGGFGKIYIVKPELSTENQIMKVVPSIYPSEVLHLQRLQASKNVIKLYNYHITDTETKLWMEYCPKGSMEDALKDTNGLAEERVKTIMKAVFQTLAQCHDQDLIHGDVKAGNFLENQQSSIVAIDFGNASCQEHFNHSHGTPHYMSPEQLNQSTTYKSDIWAAGIMMYRLLSNCYPFDDRNNPYQPSLTQIWKEIFIKDITFSAKIWQTISESAKQFIQKLLQKNPDQRLNALEALQNDWFHSQHSNLSQDQIIEKRKIRYELMPSLKRDLLTYVGKELHLSPEELSSSPHTTTRASQKVKVIIETFYNTSLDIATYKEPNFDFLKLKGNLKTSVDFSLEMLYDIWNKELLPLYAIASS